MNCLECGALLGQSDTCPNCGANVRMVKKILATSNALYNKGLDCAKNRDLMQAIEYLKSSVQYNKNNTQARNLLGLVYYEVGEVVEALGEWVISKNLQPEENAAGEYLDKIQKSRGKLETANQSIRKFNQALVCARQGDLDVAIIQLKKVVVMNSRFLKAYQLLALLYIQQNRYDLAMKYVKHAERIDEQNAMTQSYKKVCIARRRHVDKKKKEFDPPVFNSKNAIAYKDGNDLVIKPKRMGENPAVATMVNLLIGVVIGVAAIGFLVVPTVRQNMNSDARTAVVDANESLATREQNIKSLETEIEDLEKQVEDARAETTAANDKNTSYVQLLNAYVFYEKEEYASASEAMKEVNQEYLDEDGKAVYASMEEGIADYNLKTAYNDGLNAVYKKNYEEAVTLLTTVVEKDPTYNKSQAAYYLAIAYLSMGDNENALTWFDKVAEQTPNTNIGRTSKSYARNLRSGGDASSGQDDSDDDGDTMPNVDNGDDATPNVDDGDDAAPNADNGDDTME